MVPPTAIGVAGSLKTFPSIAGAARAQTRKMAIRMTMMTTAASTPFTRWMKVR
jgi:hypothetical protein